MENNVENMALFSHNLIHAGASIVNEKYLRYVEHNKKKCDE